jgi:DNA-binding helix-hairpin-helix protein with protein kinase domain
MDLLTSIVLWLEEVHALGYAVNDLKNGNLMVSRRGQLKGIDLDTYSPSAPRRTGCRTSTSSP